MENSTVVVTTCKNPGQLRHVVYYWYASFSMLDHSLTGKCDVLALAKKKIPRITIKLRTTNTYNFQVSSRRRPFSTADMA